jgi:hypothetical protein
MINKLDLEEMVKNKVESYKGGLVNFDYYKIEEGRHTLIKFSKEDQIELRRLRKKYKI